MLKNHNKLKNQKTTTVRFLIHAINTKTTYSLPYHIYARQHDFKLI